MGPVARRASASVAIQSGYPDRSLDDTARPPADQHCFAFEGNFFVFRRLRSTICHIIKLYFSVLAGHIGETRMPGENKTSASNVKARLISMSKVSSSNSTQVSTVVDLPADDRPSAHSTKQPSTRTPTTNQGSRFEGLQKRASVKGAAPHESTATGVAGSTSPARTRWHKGFQVIQARKQRTQELLEILREGVPGLLEQHQAAKADYLKQAAALMSKGEYPLPTAFSGTVTRDAAGQMRCTDKAVEAILRFVQARHSAQFDELRLPAAGCRLDLPLDAAIFARTAAFEHGCKVHGLTMEDGKQVDADINLTAYATRQAIRKGVQGFGADARLNPATSEASDEAARSGEAIAASHDGGESPGDLPLATLDGNRASADTAPAEGPHPFKFLQDIRYEVESDHAPLKKLVEHCLNEADPATLELRGRLGAQSINSVINQKAFTKEIGIAMFASLAMSGGLTYALDAVAWKALVAVAARAYGETHPVTQFVDVLTNSVTPLVTETVDSLIVKRLLGTFQGEPLLPESVEKLLDDLKDSAGAGSIAAVGSIPNNAAALNSSIAMLPVQALTNQVAASTSGAMVPLEIANAHDEMAAGVTQKMNEGFFPAPAANHTEAASTPEAKAALRTHIRAETKSALEAAPGWGMAVNSMGIGSVLSFAAGFLPVDIPARLGLVSDSVQKIASIMLNTPTEILSLGTNILTANHLGMGKWMTTDTEKNRQMISLIVDKAIQRIKSDDPGRSIEITEDELRAIEHPRLALTQPAGRKIVDAINNTTDFLAKGWASMLGQPKPVKQSETVSLDNVRMDA
ncbi:hypothetical protein F3J20_29770 [Paraburkholderia sp. Cy-641]|uniref:hypothetical protein n=1 Tax=Paraburkholderia sp. Cy-641 TaxID=2608337 RepID=UPI00141E64B6|nr:hypothetical protein [Paraburkholderia sp. Cy-641]NIF81510.1 hypothetical protein [Paraburkholderia sp. Cy-641]